MTDQEVTLEEMKQAYFEKKQRDLAKAEERDNLQVKSPSQGRLQDSSGKYIDYPEAKRLWDQKRGIQKGSWETPDNTEHNIDTPKLSEGRPSMSYEETRKAFYAKMGRVPPEVRKQQMDLKNQKRRSQYE